MAALALSAQHEGGKVLVNMEPRLLFVAQSVLVITTGSMVLLWLAEQITKFGIGNGVSVIIMVGILSSIPAAMSGMEPDLGQYLSVALVSLAIIAGIVVVVQATRRINLEQQRRVQGNKVYGGATTTLPLKINQANVIPVIFASPVIMVLGLMMKPLGFEQLFSYDSPIYRYTFAGLIIAFTYFYISITFDLNDLSNHFKQAGFFIRGIKPGKKTVDYLAYHLVRINFVGAIFLAVIAIMPQILGDIFHIGGRGGRFLLGGTGLLIVVGVMLDVIQKVGSFFLAQQYQGLSGTGSASSGLGTPSLKKTAKRF
jgi:preprotein translocase subunit SecY